MAQYGVSQPISMQGPTEEELKLSVELEQELRTFNYFETEEELQKRLDVLRRINHLVKNWVKQISIQKNLLPEEVERAGGKLFTFGSYRLGVYTRGADIDSLCVTPRHVDRTDFFTSFFQCLKEDENVTELHAVEEAFVPVIKLKYSEIELDILFARLPLKEISDTQTLEDDNLLRNLDDKSVRSLNGCRVTDEILKCIPNQATFAVALRAIKLWAKNRSIYSNSLGFLGGVSWAILVARTCQLYPNACPAVIVEKFFLIFSTWQWPHPVFLKDNDSSQRPDIQTLNDLVWDPRNRVTDRYHLMPIITPAFPEQNSTFNVTKSTRTIMTKEFKDAFQTMLEITSKKKTWRNLFKEVNFFSRYRHFICLLCATETKEDHLVFGGLVESKIRHLISFFERNQCINLCHINPKKYKPLADCELFINYEDPTVTLWFVGLELNKSMLKNIDLTQEIQQFSDLVLKAASATGAYKSTMIVRPFYVRRKDLRNWIPEDEVVKGNKYVNGKNTVLSQLSQKEVDEKNSLDDPCVSSTKSQPSCSKFENSVQTVSSCPLLHSKSCPNMEVPPTTNEPSFSQLPVENLVLSNELMNSNLENIESQEVKMKKKRSLSPSASATVVEFFKVVNEGNDTNDIPQIPSETQVNITSPPAKRPRFNFLRNSQSSTIL
ncbi:hypothetical protein FO519_005724 [Halicephalobus sp. NKZ332]|nr:hypothetical protein FO519_005724 [Halicephalobus sp. NKZ332]